ncbi:MAG: PD-(D/E)XK nuclease family protein [Mogibacterium sp.]|nr:PD-(D/E)XK nuclease family protein [Mogibacterium sp.]
MLRLFAGRENIDKERFIYDRIREGGAETLVLVPNQYTLAAETQALKYLETDCLFDVEILSMNRLGLRVLAEQGIESVRMLNKYGRFMLLTKLIKEHGEEFEVFRRSAGKLSFTAMLNDFISEFKQQNCRDEELEAMLGDSEDNPLLNSKLKELRGVIRSYEEFIKDRYTDPEDYISMYVDAIGKSKLVKGKSVWVYGYDNITPKFTNALIEIAKTANDVNFIINRSDFGLDERLIALLRGRALEHGIDFSIEEIDEESYLLQKSETIRRIESGLWSYGDSKNVGASESADNKDFTPDDLTMVCAANPYYEAENAAVYIWHLVRDLGFKMRDIQIIANDEGAMHPIIRRVFAEYGLPVFSDSVRSITDTAAVSFIVNLLWFKVYKKAPQFLFSMLKTGLTDFADEEIEELENYVRNYRVNGSMWDREFKYGADALGEDKLAELNDMRERISNALLRLDRLGEEADIAGFTCGFKKYLEEEWNISENLEAMAALADEEGLSDEAQRLVQSYDKAIDILNQMTEIAGGEKLDFAEFTELYIAGLSDVEVGVIPKSSDGLSLGTMIRTRPHSVKAVVILGANEGTMPMKPRTEGLFSIDEKDYFKSRGFALGTLDDLKMDEENAAMYRMMSKADSKLYISYALTDTSGNDASPAPVIDALRQLFPKINEQGFIKRDIISEGWALDMFNKPEDGLRHLSVHIKAVDRSEAHDDLTRALLAWYRENRKSEIDRIMEALADENEAKPLGKDIAKELFNAGGGVLPLSASAIGNYFDCPFKYFISRGLSPEEERSFETDSRSVGDVYHECLMAVAKRLTADRPLMLRVKEGSSEELLRIVDEELGRLAEEYRGGLFVSTAGEEYRLERIREICGKAAEAMAVQLSAETVESAAFEEGFGRYRRFEPIKLKVGEEEVLVEGRIDRLDVLNVEGEERVRVIDYKTGSDRLDLWKLRSGLKMQLMIYLISASSGEYEPAGMFYFNINDPMEAMNNKTEKDFSRMLGKEPGDIFKLRGAYINEEGVLGAMPKEVLSKAERETAVSREEYEELRHEVLQRIEETASGILNGKIDIRPFRENQNKIVCTYCGYKAVCRRDSGSPANAARRMPKKPEKTQKTDVTT